MDRDLAAIGEAARLPRSRFPVHWDEGFTTLLSHLGPLKNASQCCLRRCAAHLEAGETNAAFADAENALKIAELLREEPMLISQLVRLAQGILADKTVWQGLATHQWTEAQLAGFQEQLGRIDYLSGMLLAFEGERACGIEGINGLITGSTTGVYPAIPFVQNPMRLAARGMLRDNQVMLAELETQQIQDLRQAVSRVPQTGLAPVATAVGGQTPIVATPRTILVRMILPALGRVCEKAVRAQTINRMTAVACALERYRIKNGAFPETLDDLAPAFLPATPLDPVNNQPFHYKRTGDGWFEFYSVGLNGRDDGGVVKKEKGMAELDWVWPVPARPEKHLLF
jgi:hypothetical protein